MVLTLQGSTERIQGKLIPNNIITDYFSANFQTNSKDPVILTYTLFDKYFNAYLSAEMVASTFGP